MTSMQSDQIAGPQSNAEQPSPSAWFRHTRTRCREVNPTFTLFMQTTTKCAACRLLQEGAGLPTSHRIHVRRSGKVLIITDADNLHDVGPPLIAVQDDSHKNKTVYHLASDLPPGMPALEFRPATGTVTLSLCDGYWTLTAIGRPHGAVTTHDHIYHATELRD